MGVSLLQVMAGAAGSAFGGESEDELLVHRVARMPASQQLQVAHRCSPVCLASAYTQYCIVLTPTLSKQHNMIP